MSRRHRLDLLEVERLERALERRPRLAGRLFTDGGARVRGAPRAGPAMHLAARFCAKEAVAKALGPDGAGAFARWRWWPRRRRRRACGSAGRGGRARGGAGGGGRRSRSPHTARRWPAPWRSCGEPAARLARPALRGRRDARRRTRWAIERAGRAVARPDGARRRGPRAGHGGARRRRAGPRSWSARATTAATGWWPRGCCARTAARSTCSPSADPTSCTATRRQPRAPARRTAGGLRPGRARRGRRGRGRAARHRLRGRAARAGGGRDRGDQRRRTRRWWPATCPRA